MLKELRSIKLFIMLLASLLSLTLVGTTTLVAADARPPPRGAHDTSRVNLTTALKTGPGLSTLSDKNKKGSSCDLSDTQKTDCGMDIGRDQSTCEAGGCCWKPAGDGSAVPW